jgi:hypothetical protein
MYAYRNHHLKSGRVESILLQTRVASTLDRAGVEAIAEECAGLLGLRVTSIPGIALLCVLSREDSLRSATLRVGEADGAERLLVLDIQVMGRASGWLCSWCAETR